MLLSEGRMSDYKGAALMIDALPPAKQLLGDKGYAADRSRQEPAARHHAMHPIQVQPQEADRT